MLILLIFLYYNQLIHDYINQNIGDGYNDKHYASIKAQC